MTDASEAVAAEEEAAPSGLIDNVSMEAEPSEEIAPEETTVAHVAEEDKPAIPEGVPAKFVQDDQVNVAALAKSYTELESKFRAGRHKAPDQYDMSAIEEAGVASDDPVLQVYSNWAKEAGISQEHFDQLAAQVVANGAAAEQEAEFNVEAEMAQLGPNAKAIIDDQVDWARRLVSSGTWGADDFEEFRIWGGTAGGIKAIQKLRKFMGETTRIPAQVNPEPDALPSQDECYAMVKDPRYQSDPSYRKRVEQTFARVFGTEPDLRQVM